MIKRFRLSPSWRLLLLNLRVQPRAVLRRASLPDALLTSEAPSLSASEYFGFWDAMEAEAQDPSFPLRMAQAVTVETFDAPLFAALCSPDFNTGIQRIADYKELIGPLRVDVDVGAEATTVSFSCLQRPELPASLGATEILFLVTLTRMATREHVVPRAVAFRDGAARPDVFSDYLGVPIGRGDAFSLELAADDARRPFLTENREMWTIFEPHLRQRLEDLDETIATHERVRVALLELLPSDQATIGAVAQRLGMGHRTLQRRLRRESTTFQEVLDKARDQLARHYLQNTDYVGAEISFLLGFAKPSSFYRAFHRWTGMTPEAFRTRARHDKS